MSTIIAALRHYCLFVLLSAAACAHAIAAPPSIETFFANSTFAGAKLSPSGRYLATLAAAPGGRDHLSVIDLTTRKATVVAGNAAADVGHFAWVNDERLLFDVSDKKRAEGDIIYAPGLFAVNRDGSGFLQLARQNDFASAETGSHITAKDPLPWHTYMLEQAGAQDSDSVYVEDAKFVNHELRQTDLVRVNTVTGKTSSVPSPAGQVGSWLLDFQGEPRIATGSTKDKTIIYYRDPATSQWRTLASFSLTDGKDAIAPLGFAPDGTLFVAARAGKDTMSMYKFDLAAGKVNPEPLVVTDGYDFSGDLITGRGKVLGVRFQTDAASSGWFDRDMQSVQQAVDKKLPGLNNLISVPARPTEPWVLVRSFSDVSPTAYEIYNTSTGEMVLVGQSHAQVDSKQMGHQQSVRFKARDGLPIPALLTLPRAGTGKNLPLVVLVHGGPFVRGNTWGWNPQSQFLASRGYAVLEPEFRGGLGLGERHFRAGWKQWGLAMQDDVADAARWAIAQGIADPKRICIAGASYGGYATLMGLVNDPDLFRCGIDWVGVTDINLLFNDTWYASSDASDEWKKYGMPVLIGDQTADAARFKATSPLEQAARIRQPLLLAYGGSDRRVPIFHGRKFYSAVKSTNPLVEWVEYPEEGHGWRLEKNRYDFWSRVEKFLEKNIGKAP
jgi:dipeptidyl aminopeptidase/acylaminoacyl peptidase